MIILTKAAKRGFRTLKPDGRSDIEALRLDRTGTIPNGEREPKLALYLGAPEEGDEPIKYRGEPLLYVSRKVSVAFDGCVVDLTETPEGTAFAIGPPEAGRESRSS